MTDPLVAALLVGVGGACGATARHAVGLAVDGREAIVIVNGAGSFVLGWLLIAPVGSELAIAAAVGFCGAFTTFSSFAVETVSTAEDGQAGVAVGFALANLAAAFLAFFLGSALATAVW